MYDVVVVGGSIAGAAVALELVQRNFNVLLIERESFPRRNPCGEGLSPLGVRLLSRLGLLDDMQKAPHFPFHGFLFKRETASLALSLGKTPGIGVERSVLDALFLAALTKQKTLALVTGCPVLGIDEEEGFCRVRYGKVEVAARFVVLACGSNSRLLSSCCFLGPRPKLHDHSSRSIWRPSLLADSSARRAPHGRYGLSQTWEGDFTRPLSQVVVFVRHDHEVYCTRVGERRLNVSLLASRSFFQEQRAKISVAPLCAELGFSGNVVLPPQGAGPFVGRASFPRQSRIIPIGDACEVFDPAGGMGMTHALLSAGLASAALCESLAYPSRTHLACDRYYKRQRAIARSVRLFTHGVRTLVRFFGAFGFPNWLPPPPLARCGEFFLESTCHYYMRRSF